MNQQNQRNQYSNIQRFAINQGPTKPPDFDPPTRPKTPPRSDPTYPSNVSQSQSKAGEPFDPSYLSPRRGLRPGFNESRSGSEADSLLDLYGHPRSLGERSVVDSMERERAVAAHEEPYLDDEDSDRSRWIHRDKLAIIESHEMREAGIKLPRPQTSSSTKSKSRREIVQDLPDLPRQDAEMVPSVEREKRRTQSPVRQEEDREDPLENNFDLRSPEEIAANGSMESSPNMYLRKSSSRIPLPRSSPMPIPQEQIERDTPLPRKRGASGNWTGEENGISYYRARSRGNSAGSQVLLDDADLIHSTPTPASRPSSRDSPSKTRIPSNKPNHSRKPSLTNTPPNQPPKPRQSSANTTNNSPRTPSSTARPKSRSGLEPRPTTAVNRPEGDPPWLATMYKPDPRLPPDQQLLPTHAKRLEQEQWNQAQKASEQRRLEGKASPNLPREFSPLAEHTINGLQPSSREADEKTLREKPPAQWPLALPSGPNKTAKSDDSPATTALPDISQANQHAGYSPIPRINNRQGESPVSPLPLGMGQRPLDPFEKERLAREGGGEKSDGSGRGGGGGDGNEKAAGGKAKEKEKGCGCCVVM